MVALVLGWSGRVPGRLVSHFLSFVFQAGCLFLACLPLPFICFPLPFICLPLPFICFPLLFICLPVLFICLPGWVLVVGFPAGLSPTSFHLSPTSFRLSTSPFHLSFGLGACGRVIHVSPRSVTASPPFSAGHVAFLFICPRSVTAGVRPFRWPLSPRSVLLVPCFRRTR